MILQTEKQKFYTPQEYLDLEIEAKDRHEYRNGEIIVMSGGTPNHNRITGNFYAIVNFAFKGQPYDVFITDQRLWIPSQNVQEYILIEQYSPHIEQFSKTESGQWLLSDYDGQEATITLKSVSLEIPLSDIYDKVNFQPKNQ